MAEPPPIEASPPNWSALWRWLPGVATLRGYRRRDARGDLVAGLAVTALLVPQGMAYAELAGLPAVTGLYTTVIALLAYAVFGPSRILVLGPDSALAPLILATILPLVGAGGDAGSCRPSRLRLEGACGGPRWDRTNDLGIKSPLLYRLS